MNERAPAVNVHIGGQCCMMIYAKSNNVFTSSDKCVE